MRASEKNKFVCLIYPTPLISSTRAYNEISHLQTYPELINCELFLLLIEYWDERERTVEYVYYVRHNGMQVRLGPDVIAKCFYVFANLETIAFIPWLFDGLKDKQIIWFVVCL